MVLMVVSLLITMQTDQMAVMDGLIWHKGTVWFYALVVLITTLFNIERNCIKLWN